ncbi:MAG: heparinase [Lentisphaerae bacterium]|nr:heparinase [Lentisphaerota bacterium]
MIAQRLFQIPDTCFTGDPPWHPFPRARDRKAWESLPGETRRTLVQAGEATLGCAWPLLPATEILAYRRDGNRRRYEKAYFERRTALVKLVLAECCEGQGRFVDELVNGIWCICEETSWCLPAHVKGSQESGGLPDVREPVVDLFAAETGGLLACVLELLGDELGRVSDLIPQRIRSEIEARILDPALARDDFWWMGLGDPGRKLNNWTPWIVSNWLLCSLLADDNPGRRLAGIYKAAGCLDRYLAQLPADGGCDEGPSYWGRAGGSLFDGLEILHSASHGELTCYDEPLVREIGAYIARVHIGGDWFVNFADAPARPRLRPHTVYGYGVRTQQAALMQLGAWLGQQEQTSGGFAFGSDLYRALQALFTFPITTAVTTPPPCLRDAWLPDIEVFTARDRAGEWDGWFVAAKGGHNGESHNHNDVGSFVVFRGGAPLLVDAGVGEYTRQTFSSERYTIWTMRSDHHNLLPTIDGVGQMPGAAFRARGVDYRQDGQAVAFALELQEAYPPEARIERWHRQFVFQRSRQITIEDTYRLTADVQALSFTLLTPSQVTLTGEREIQLESRMLPDALPSADGRVTVEMPAPVITCEEIPLEDPRLAQVWGRRLQAVHLLIHNPPREGVLRLLIQ